jgi:hypothetical protein
MSMHDDKEIAVTDAGTAPREIVCVGWDGRSEPIYRYRDELDLPEWQQARVFPPQSSLPVKSVNVGKVS